MPLILAIVMPIALGIFWLVTTSRAATETPSYKVVRTDAPFEIRDYPAFTLATIPMDDGEMNRSFGQLFRRKKATPSSPITTRRGHPSSCAE